MWHDDKAGMEKIIVDYFSNLFDSQVPAVCDPTLANISRRVPDTMNDELLRLFLYEEIKLALFQTRLTKAPGLDGMTPGFYKKHGTIVGIDVCNGVRSLLFSGSMLRIINFTYVTLISKSKDSTVMTQLRPISLCNVLYKICSKMLTNRPKRVLPEIISPSQSAFVHGSLISDKSMVASKIAYFMHKKSSG